MHCAVRALTDGGVAASAIILNSTDAAAAKRGLWPRRSQQEFAELAKSWPAKRLVAIRSSLPGVQPIKKFKDHKAAATRIWERIQGLGAPAQPAKPKAERKA
jgi:hypothetical protein